MLFIMKYLKMGTGWLGIDQSIADYILCPKVKKKGGTDVYMYYFSMESLFVDKCNGKLSPFYFLILSYSTPFSWRGKRDTKTLGLDDPFK